MQVQWRLELQYLRCRVSHTTGQVERTVSLVIHDGSTPGVV